MRLLSLYLINNTSGCTGLSALLHIHSSFGHGILFTLGNVGSSLVYLLIIFSYFVSALLYVVFETVKLSSIFVSS